MAKNSRIFYARDNKRMDHPNPSSLLISAVNAVCSSAMGLKRSKKEPFPCLLLAVTREKKTYDVVPVHGETYESSVESARRQVMESYGDLSLYVIAYEGTVTREGATSDVIMIEACQVGQKVRFNLVRKFTPPGFLSKARAEEKLSLINTEPERNPAD